MRLFAMFAVVTATLCVACPPSTGNGGVVPEAAPSTAPLPSAAPAPSSATCAAACGNVLANVPQCPEGHFADCETTCKVIQVDPHQVQPNLAQLAAAKTVAQVRAAGWTCRIDGG